MVGNMEMAQHLITSFDGWHHVHSNPHGVSATTLAVINSSSKNCGSTVRKTIRELGAVNIGNPAVRRQHPFTEYVSIMHNRGQSLQSRPDHMVLTRTVQFLVKGAHASHAATMCQLEGYACLTDPHRTVEASTCNDLHLELQRIYASSNFPKTSLAGLFCKYNDSLRFETIKSIIDFIVMEKHIPPVGQMVNLMLSAAVLHTGFSDAGAKFRDRSARQEAGRHYGAGIRSLVLTALLPAPAP